MLRTCERIVDLMRMESSIDEDELVRLIRELRITNPGGGNDDLIRDLEQTRHTLPRRPRPVSDQEKFVDELVKLIEQLTTTNSNGKNDELIRDLIRELEQTRRTLPAQPLPLSDQEKFVVDNYDFMQQQIRKELVPENVGAVHVAIMHRYGSAGPTKELHGKVCLVAGLERSKYGYKGDWVSATHSGAFDFFGGKIEVHHRDIIYRILKTLYQELWEEMGVKLICPLNKIVIGTLKTGRDQRSFLLVFAINGISSKKITAEMEYRCSNRSLPYKYKEMTKCQHITLNEVMEGKCSQYVFEQFPVTSAIFESNEKSWPILNANDVFEIQREMWRE